MCFAGASSPRQMAEVGALQRLSEWKSAQRIPVRGNELAAVQLVQQVTNVNKVLNRLEPLHHWAVLLLLLSLSYYQ